MIRTTDTIKTANADTYIIFTDYLCPDFMYQSDSHEFIADISDKFANDKKLYSSKNRYDLSSLNGVVSYSKCNDDKSVLIQVYAVDAHNKYHTHSEFLKFNLLQTQLKYIKQWLIENKRKAVVSEDEFDYFRSNKRRLIKEFNKVFRYSDLVCVCNKI